MARRLTMTLIILTLFAFDCSRPGKDESGMKGKNEAVMTLTRLEESAPPPRRFRLEGTVRIPLKAVYASLGNRQSVSMDFSVNNGGIVNQLLVYLPAAPTLHWLPDRDGSVKLDARSLPITLNDVDYVPFSEAQRGLPIEAVATLSSIIKSADGIQTLAFGYERITLNSFRFEKGVCSLDMDLALVSKPFPDAGFGRYRADVRINAAGFKAFISMTD
jgi:hypothetical protein